MARFVGRRLLLIAGVLVVFSFGSFALFVTQFPGPIYQHPVLPEYWKWVRGIPTGTSIHNGLQGPILPSLVPAIGHTMLVIGYATVLVVVLGALLGGLAAALRGTIVDALIRGVTYVAWAVPAFLLALLVGQLAAGSVTHRGLGPFPPAGWAGNCAEPIGSGFGSIQPCAPAGTGATYVVHALQYATLPAITLAVAFIGLHARYLRTGMIIALDAPFTATARAKGLPERLVVFRHAFRVALGAWATGIVGDFGAIFSASIAVDWIFNYFGLGSLFIREMGIDNIAAAYGSLDVYALEALLLVVLTLLLTASLLSELVLAAFDPRVSLEGS